MCHVFYVMLLFGNKLVPHPTVNFVSINLFTNFMANSGVLKRTRAVPVDGLTDSTFPPQLSEIMSKRLEIRLTDI